MTDASTADDGDGIDDSRLYDELRRRQRWLDASGEIVVHLLEGSDPAEVLRLIAHRAVELTGADYTLIALPNPAAPADARELTVAVCIGMGADTITGRTIPLSGTTSGAVYADQLPRSVDKLSLDLAEGLGINFGPALALPLRISGSVAGVLLTLRTAGAPPFDEAQLRVAASFADQAALVLRHAENETARRKLEIFADRDRIARDLHDHVIQRLFAIGLSLQGTRRRSTAPEVDKRLDEHIDQLQDVIHEVRDAIFDLHDDESVAAPLPVAVRSIVAELTADSPVRVTVRVSGALTGLPPALRNHAEAVIREAVSNVVRHAGAQEMTAAVSAGVDHLTIAVVDDGVGMADTVARSGLHNLAERAAECNGTFRVSATPTGGTHLLWSVPLGTTA